MNIKSLYLFGLSLLIISCSPSGEPYDILIKNAVIYDGSGNPPIEGSVAINGDTIAAVGQLDEARGLQEIDAGGMAVSPGFINMLSWSTETLLYDGRAMSDIKQGVTLEVMGEGWSMGPLSPQMKSQQQASQGDIQYEIQWTTLGEYLQHLEDKGVSPNVASFVGATTLRIHQLGYENRQPTYEEMENMRALVAQAMQEGALGVGSSLIYAPAFYALTGELVELCRVASEYGGMYITHMRSEGNRLPNAINEVIYISKEANIRSEIYHLKAAGKSNWDKLDDAIAKIDSARAAGIGISTNMYTYEAGATGLNAAMPPWVQEGGYDEWARRLQNPQIRQQLIREMQINADDWENLYAAAGGAENLLLVDFKADSLKKYTGKTLAEVAEIRGTSPEETAMDLVVQDGSRVGTVYFLMSEENVKKKIRMPYMSFGSDAAALAPEGVFLKSNTHPRAYGNFARLLGKYVREEKVIALEEAIRRLTSLPASNLRIKGRGALIPGFFADIVIFDPETVTDHATYQEPHQFATGVQHVFVNGVQVLQSGQHTGAMPGRFVKGPGYRQKPNIQNEKQTSED